MLKVRIYRLFAGAKLQLSPDKTADSLKMLKFAA